MASVDIYEARFRVCRKMGLAGRIFLAFSAGVSVAVSCSLAQEAPTSAPAGPLELRPVVPKAAQLAGPLPSPAKKVAAKPSKRVQAQGKLPAKPVAAVVGMVPAGPAPERVVALSAASPKGPAVPEKLPEKAAAAEPAKLAEVRPPFDEYVVAQYCTALSSAASDGRLAWQAKRLDDMEARLRERVAELEAKRSETADWLRRREDALRKADETVVAIYAKMKPDAAAAQFSAMDESGAAAILAKLNPRSAGIILNEIDSGRAARIAAEMAGLGPRRDSSRGTP